MKLTTNKLAELAHGAVKVIDDEGKTKFYRFTEAQRELYKNSGNESFYTKTFTSAGVRLVFKTDSKSMFLNADAYNKAIGGEIFIPALADTKEDFVPDYILVAYGTNDWSHCELDVFEKNCKEFYEILSRKYPSAKIFALTPIWRKNHYEEHNCGTFSSAADYIEAVAEKLDNVYCLRGFDFVPHQENMFGDLCLHPNDDGFAHYAKNLCEAVKDILD